MANETLDSRLGAVIGGATAKALERAFGITTVRDLLWHVPRRYSQRGELTPLTGLPVGEHVTVLAQVLDVRSRRMQRGGTLLEARITDGTGTLTLTFFNQPYRSKDLFAGARGIFAGKVSEYRGSLQLQHPDYEMFTDGAEASSGEAGISAEKDQQLDEAAALAYSQKPVPIYPATSHLPSWTIAKTVGLALDAMHANSALVDPLPAEMLASEHLLPLSEAFELVHRPRRSADWPRARDSLRFREAFTLQLSLLDRRRRTGLSATTPRPAGGSLLARFDAALPFELTDDQRQAAHVIADELAAPHPMHRLLQGEVGSGKTVVALRAMLQVADSAGQSALLAPTEVLASQHFRSIVQTLGPDLAAQVNPVLLTGSLPAAERKRALLSLASGNSRIAVGTHALLGDQVKFFDLGLVVVDEQHRFGVEQRETLRAKGATETTSGGPHVLAMTATPIPRTVALTAFGDLEVTTIRQLPAGRQGIETFAVPELEMPKRAERVWARMAEDVAQGRQAYVVCPAISTREGLEEGFADSVDQSDDAGSSALRVLANVQQTLEELRSMPAFAAFRIEGLSGAMSNSEKDRIMTEFAAGEVDILVATTVIEVGVNVPNASIMVVRDADRFGISQLHQLRGRVGRGEHAGLCLLMTQAAPGSAARERIDAVAATTDGFALAEVDLELRREGDILGTAQSGGRSALKLLRVAEHGDVIERARELAGRLLSDDPELTDHQLLAGQLAQLKRESQFQNLAKS